MPSTLPCGTRVSLRVLSLTLTLDPQRFRAIIRLEGTFAVCHWIRLGRELMTLKLGGVEQIKTVETEAINLGVIENAAWMHAGDCGKVYKFVELCTNLS